MTDTFFYVKKYGIPFIDKPLFFNIEGYIDMIDIAQRHRRNSTYSSLWLRFNKNVAKAYDTHYFRKEDKNVEFLTWAEIEKDIILDYEINLKNNPEKEDIVCTM